MNKWKPNSRPQESFFESNADELLYGGAAGGGKSECLISEAIRDVNKDNFHALLLRRKFPELQRTLIPKSHEMLKNSKAAWNGQARTWTFPNGATIEFGHCQHDHDVYQYDSAEYDYIGFDELTTFTYFMYSFIKSRLRGKNPNIFRRVRAGSNPGRVGHAWVKNYFPVGKEQKVKKLHKELPDGKKIEIKIEFIPCLPTDNPTLMANDPDYINRLEMMPEPYRSALRWGDWNINVGAYFNEFAENTHVIKSVHNAGVDIRDAIKIVSMDWGFDAPSSIHWTGFWDMGDFTRAITFREIYGAKVLPSARARQIEQFDNEKPSYKVADPSAFNLQAGRPGVIDQMISEGCTGWQRGNNDRLNGWMVVKEWLQIAPDGLPYWMILDCCPELIRTIPEMVKDEQNPEDIDTDGEDHAVDEIRYLFMSRPRPKKIIQPVVIPELSLAHFRQVQKEMSGRKGVGAYALNRN